MDKVDPFTLRMLERARLRQEKLESKLQPSGTPMRNKKPFAESNNLPVSPPVKSPTRKDGISDSPKLKSNQENIVTRSSVNRTLTRTNVSSDSDVAVEINIVHQNNVQVDVQVEEREVRLVDYLKEKEKKMDSQTGSSTSFYSLSSSDFPVPGPSVCGYQPKTPTAGSGGEHSKVAKDVSNSKADITQDGKLKLRRLGQLYSDDPNMSSPVNSRTEITSYLPESDLRNDVVTSTTSSSETDVARSNAKNKRGGNKRFAALADRYNNMEDDIRHIDYRIKDKADKKTLYSDSSAKVCSSPQSSVSSSRVTRRSLDKAASKSSPKTIAERRSPRQSISSIKSPRQMAISDSLIAKITTSRSPRQSGVGIKSPKALLPTRQSPRQSPKNSLESRQSPRHSLVKESNSSSVRRSPRQSMNDKTTKPNSRVQEARKMFQSSAVGANAKRQPSNSPSCSPMKWDKKIIQDLESKGFKRVSISQSRLVYDFSSSNHQQAQGDKPTPVSNMAAVAVTSPSRSPRNNLTKRPSIKKHKAPQPPKNVVTNDDNEKENSSSDNFVSSVEDLVNGKSENDSGNDAISQKESTCSTPDITRSQHSLNSASSSNRSSPITRHRRMAENTNGSPGGNVMTKAAIFETQKFDSPRNTDPALMSMRERKALFEKNKGQAIIPKAAFGMAPPIKALHGTTNNDKGGAVKKPILSSINIKPKIEPKPEVAPIHSATARLGHISHKMAHVLQPSMGEKEILDKTRREREEEMMMLKNRFNRTKMINSDLDSIETEIDHEDEQTSEDSPLMGGGDSRMGQVAASSLSINKKNSNKDMPDDEIIETDGVIGNQPTKRRSSTDSPQVVSALEDVKRIKVAKPRDGGLYPCLSDIEQPTTEDEKPSCLASPNSSSDSAANEHVNEDQHWGDTSFGQELLKVVGIKKPVNKAKARDVIKATRKSREKAVTDSRDDSDASSNECNNSELDDLLDEVMDDDSEGPTPPKMNKNANSAKPSTSFSYKKASELVSNADEDRFRSPLKTPPRSAYDEAVMTGKPLVHTVSFYRKQQQSQGSQNSTPVRVVRRDSKPENVRKAEEEVEKKRAEKAATVDARARVKELLEEVTKQNTIISQASQALNLCASTIEFSGSTEQAEGERLLLLATHRRLACLHEVQRLQIEGLPAHTSQVITLRMEAFSLPLRREYVRQLNADGALGHYFVCLVKCQERVIATSMVKSAPDSFSVSFPDKVRLEGLDPNFKITVEVYALQASKEILPHDVKYHIATKKSGKLATPRKGCKGADLKAPLPTASPGGPSAVRAPSLQPNGYCIFGYSQIGRNSFSLNKVNVSGPVDGSLKINLSVEKRVMSLPNRSPKKGFLTMFEEAGGFGAWHRRWCVLQGQDLSYWRYPDHEGSKTPMGSIEVSAIISEKVIPAPRELCARPHTIFLETSTGETQENVTSPNTRRSGLCLKMGGKRTHLLAADTKAERDEWMKAFNSTLADVRAMME